MIELVGDDAPKKFNQLCREQMKERLLKDILVDLTVCDLEGWDKMEYLNDLNNMIKHFFNSEVKL